MTKECDHKFSPSTTGYFESSDCESCWFIVRLVCKKCGASEVHVAEAIDEGELEAAT